MGIRLLGMTPPEVSRVCFALDALDRHLPEELVHIRRALQFIMVSPRPWSFDPSIRAHTAMTVWGRGMMLVHRPSALSIEEIAVSVSHEARHIVIHPNGTHSYREHAFGPREPTLEERRADPIYARDDEVRRVLSAGLRREYASRRR